LESQLEQARKHVKATQPATKRLQYVGRDVVETQQKLAKTKEELEALAAQVAKALNRQQQLVQQQKQQEEKLARLRKEEAELHVLVGTEGKVTSGDRGDDDMEEEADADGDDPGTAEALAAKEAEITQLRGQLESLQEQLAAKDTAMAAAAVKRAAPAAENTPAAKK
jgi:chromosome segregation ATPase